MQYVQLYGTTIIYNSTGTAIIWQVYDLDNKIESTWSRVVCYWNMSEVKEGKLKYNIKERIRKTSQRMQINREIKWGKLNIRERNKKEF